MSLSGRYQILGLFIDTVTADDKYCCNIRERFPQPMQMQLHKKAKTFSHSFILFLKFT